MTVNAPSDTPQAATETPFLALQVVRKATLAKDIWGFELRHPQDGRALSIAAPLEKSFADVLCALGWDGIRY